MFAHDGGHDRQAEPGTSAGAGVVGLPEPVESVLERVGGEPGAVIAHRHQRRVAVAARADVDAGAGGRVAQGIADEVGYRLAEMVIVAGDHHGLGRVEHDRPVGRHGDGVAAGVGGHDGEVDGRSLHGSRLVQPGEEQQVLHEDLHPGRLLLDAAQDDGQVHAVARGVEAEQLCEPLDGRQRCAQFMGGVGQELA